MPNKYKYSYISTHTNTDDTSLGNIIRQFRKNNLLYVKDLAKILGCSRDSILKWESNRGKPNKTYMNKLRILLKGYF